MVTFRNLLPAKQDIVLVFAVCVVTIYSWSIFSFFDKVPAWVLFVRSWDLVGVFAYTQVFAFLESLVVLLGLILLSAILPRRFFRDRFVAQGTATSILTAVCAIVLQYRPWMIHSLKALILGFGFYITSNVMCYVLIWRFKHLKKLLGMLAERLMVFLYFYVPVTILSLIVIVARNV